MGRAPAFRDLSKRYPIQHLAEALAEGIVTGHSDMPEFTFEPCEIEALLTICTAWHRKTLSNDPDQCENSTGTAMCRSR